MFRIVPCTYQMIHVLAIVTLFKISIISRHYVPPVLMKTYPASPIQYVAKTQEPNLIKFLFTYQFIGNMGGWQRATYFVAL